MRHLMAIVEHLIEGHDMETTRAMMTIELPAPLLTRAQRAGIDVSAVCQTAIIEALAEKAWHSPLDTAARMDQLERERVLAAGGTLARGDGPTEW
jgi:post-segregation antitoxin (ccd killing protein)